MQAANSRMIACFLPATTADPNPPVISGCPGTASGVAAPGSNVGSANWIEPTATDDDGLPVAVSMSATPGSVFPIGESTVTYTFTDSAGNQATCVIIVTISREFAVYVILSSDQYETPPN